MGLFDWFFGRKQEDGPHLKYDPLGNNHAHLVNQRDMAEKLYKDDPDFAMRIAMGEEKAPNGILAAAVYAKVCDEAEKSEDLDICMHLANSLHNSKISAKAQNLKFRNPDSPIEAMKDVVNARRKTCNKTLPQGKTSVQVIDADLAAAPVYQEHDTEKRIKEEIDRLTSNMNFKQAQKVVSAYGGFIEYALFRYNIVIFLEDIPESLLPYPPLLIEVASNIVAKSYHDKGDKKAVADIQKCMCWLQGFGDDEKSILAAVKNFNNKKFLDLNTESIKGYRSNPNHQNYISGLFTNISLDKVDFENPDFTTAFKIFNIYSKYLKYTHIGLMYIFCQKIPETLLPFPKTHLIKALDTCLSNDDKNTEAYTSGKTILEDYVDADVAISELIKNSSDKEIRDTIISDLKKYQLKYIMETLHISD